MLMGLGKGGGGHGGGHGGGGHGGGGGHHGGHGGHGHGGRGFRGRVGGGRGWGWGPGYWSGYWDPYVDYCPFGVKTVVNDVVYCDGIPIAGLGDVSPLTARLAVPATSEVPTWAWIAGGVAVLGLGVLAIKKFA